ncbi:MAG: porin family protein [Muribaculaceae bacterium]|nr:porin family protein [Muribaculaceae bacterium]
MKAWIKTAVAAVTLSATSFTAGAEGYAGEKSLGLLAGYNTYNHSAIAGFEFTYRFSRNFRLAPGVLYAFRNQRRDALMVNVNAHFPIPCSTAVTAYPLAGINYSSWNFRHFDPATANDVTSRDSRFGLNAGAGVDFALRGNLRLGAEAYYTFIKSYSGAAVAAKIAYAF